MCGYWPTFVTPTENLANMRHMYNYICSTLIKAYSDVLVSSHICHSHTNFCKISHDTYQLNLKYIPINMLLSNA